LRASWYQYDSRISEKSPVVAYRCGVVAPDDRCRIMDSVPAGDVAYTGVGVV